MAATESHIRGDIQAFRAVAVMAVVLYHLWPNQLPAGFLGVDVFFVISGFVIAGAIIREVDRSGTLSLPVFWARRAKRLLPASLTVLLATVVATILWVPHSLWERYLNEVIASVLYFQNWRLALDSVDYHASTNTPSPVQHFWSLSVEEQFYLAFPLLLGLVLMLGRRRVASRHLLVGVLAAVTVVSFIYCVWYTTRSEPVAYFSTVARAWQFGVGALLAFVRVVCRRIPALILTAVGAGTLMWSFRWFPVDQPFPGTIALVPTLATAALIAGSPWAGDRFHRVVTVRPVRFVGDVSYGIYLWHWPPIVLVPFITGSALDALTKCAVLAGTVVVAWISTRFIEGPIRHSSTLLGGHRRPRAVAAWSIAAMTLVVGIGARGATIARNRNEQAVVASAATTLEFERCLGARSLSPDCAGVVPADVLTPAPEAAPTDDGNDPACWSSPRKPEFALCSLGPIDADVRILAVGDSHNNVFLPAYRILAEREGWRIDVAGHAGCYWTAARQTMPDAAADEACNNWKAALTRHLEANEPYSLIVATNARNVYRPAADPGLTVEQTITAGLVDVWSEQIDRGVALVAIRDNPAMARGVADCVAASANPNVSCSEPRAGALGEIDPLVDAANQLGAHLVDFSDVYCPGDRCLTIIGNVVVYMDHHHLTATFAGTLTDRLGLEISAALP